MALLESALLESALLESALLESALLESALPESKQPMQLALVKPQQFRRREALTKNEPNLNLDLR